jgi:hypothetical protein
MRPTLTLLVSELTTVSRPMLGLPVPVGRVVEHDQHVGVVGSATGRADENVDVLGPRLVRDDGQSGQQCEGDEFQFA